MGHLRGTLHLVSAPDAVAQYPILADVMARSWKSSPFAKQLVGVDLDAVLARARETVEERPMTPAELGTVLSPDWPDRDAPSLAYAARFLLPLVQVPPRGLGAGPADRRTRRPRPGSVRRWRRSPISATSSCATSPCSVRRP